MNGRPHANLAAASMALLAFLLFVSSRPTMAQQTVPTDGSDRIILVTGTIFDQQNMPVVNALVTLIDGTTDEPLTQDVTQSNGRYAMTVGVSVPEKLIIEIKRPHFEEAQVELQEEAVHTSWTASFQFIINVGIRCSSQLPFHVREGSRLLLKSPRHR